VTSLIAKHLSLGLAVFLLGLPVTTTRAQWLPPNPEPEPEPPPPELCAGGPAIQDPFYAPLWSCDQGQIDDMWSQFELDADDWASFGFSDPCNYNMPLGRLFDSLQLMAHASVDPPACSGGPDNILAWSYCWAAGHIQITTNCFADPDREAEGARILDDDVELFASFFDDSVVGRASVIMHEARHVEGGCGHSDDFDSIFVGPGGGCLRGASCDGAYHDGCSGFFSSSGKGANAYQVDFLIDFVAHSRPDWTTPDIRLHAALLANSLLETAFYSDPCFRFEISGNTVGGIVRPLTSQCEIPPLTGCEGFPPDMLPPNCIGPGIPRQ